MTTADLPSDNVLRVRVTDDLVLDGGTWHLAADHDRHPVAVVEPPVKPMYRQVAEYLEAKPVPPEGNPSVTTRRVRPLPSACGGAPTSPCSPNRTTGYRAIVWNKDCRDC